MTTTKTTKIMAVRTELLFPGKDNYFEGFQEARRFDFIETILDSYEFRPRNTLELDATWKQPIPYTVLLNPAMDRIWAFKRGTFGDERLVSKWSWGLGGHIEKKDENVGGNVFLNNIVRELKEEIGFDQILSGEDVYLSGYINDDSNEVGEVHFGILYVLKSDTEEIEPQNEEITFGKWMTIDEIEDISYSGNYIVETWSKLILPELRKVINQNHED